MAAKQSKVIINCAVTGSVHIPTMSDYLPITPQEIAESALKAAEAGATTVHLHARDPQNGKPVSDMGIFREICTEIHSSSDVVQCTTTGGGAGMSLDERVRVIKEFEPELASMNIGSMNYGSFRITESIEKYKYDWEKPFLESTKDWVYTNTFASMEAYLKTMGDCGTKPELEVYDIGGLYMAAYLLEKGFLRAPLYFQFVMGVLGGIGASVEHMMHLKHTADSLFGQDFVWSVLPVGRYEFPFCTVASVLGGNVRVGMEDNLYLKKGVPLKSNEEAVKKIKLLLETLGMEIASPDEGREILNLKGKENTKF